MSTVVQYIFPVAESLVRLPEETRRAQTAVSECLRQTPLERMHAVMDAISCVSSCPWRVNTNVRVLLSVLYGILSSSRTRIARHASLHSYSLLASGRVGHGHRRADLC